MKELLSIIVPVYNNASYLRQTLRTILQQTYRDFELILVDDGSTDDSLTICKEMAEQDSRIRIIEKKNGGVSSARNRGLETAKGKYIAFVDGDDCLDADMYAQMIAILKKEQADFVNCRVIKENTFHPIPYQNCTVIVHDHPLNCLSQKGQFIDSSLNKVYLRTFVGETRFDETISYSEDKLFVTELFFKANRIALMDHVFYHYIQHKDSLSWQDSYAVWDGNFRVNQRIYQWIQSRDDAETDIKTSIFHGYVKSIIALLRYDIKYRQKERFEQTLSLYQNDLHRFMRETSLPLAKRLEYWTYIRSYFFASLVHYYFKRKK